MEDYEKIHMKKNLERIHYCVTLWRKVTDAMENYPDGEDVDYEVPEEVADDMMTAIENLLEEAGYYE